MFMISVVSILRHEKAQREEQKAAECQKALENAGAGTEASIQKAFDECMEGALHSAKEWFDA